MTVEVDYKHLKVRGDPARATMIQDRNVQEHMVCCGCQKTFGKTQFLVYLNLVATWDYPHYLVYSSKKGYTLNVTAFSLNRAFAVICAPCYYGAKPIRFAVEHDKDYSYVTYHDVDSLEYTPQIHAKELQMKVEVLYSYYESQNYEGNVVRVAK